MRVDGARGPQPCLLSGPAEVLAGFDRLAAKSPLDLSGFSVLHRFKSQSPCRQLATRFLAT